jgi:betaine-aldehyde dehydrogenase
MRPRPICRDEAFGPVAVVLPFDDEADAIRICNDSDYGFRVGMDADGAKALRVVRAMEAGAISVNSTARSATAPVRRLQQSGLGGSTRCGVLDHYTELKNVFISTE